MRTRKTLAVAVFFAVMMSVLLTGCPLKDPEMKISIDGKEFSLDCKVQDLIDAGFQIAETGSPTTVIDEADYPVIQARLMDSEFYYLITGDGLPCDVSFHVYNNDSSDLAFTECKVYLFNYDAGSYSEFVTRNPETAEVLLNGIDFKFTDCKETVDALKDSGFKFKDSEVEEFCADDMYGKSVIGPTGLSSHDLSIFHDYDYEKAVVRTNGFEISLKLNYEFKDR